MFGSRDVWARGREVVVSWCGSGGLRFPMWEFPKIGDPNIIVP